MMMYSNRAICLVVMVLSLSQAGCATTAGLVGFGQDEPVRRAEECAPGSESRPLAKWGRISGDLLVRSPELASNTGERRRIRLTSPVAVVAQGNDLYIADVGQQAILRFNRGSQTVRVFARVPDMNADVRLYIDRSLSVYLVDPRAGSVTRYDLDGNPDQGFRNATELSQPVAALVDDGRAEVLVADQLGARILVFDRNGTVLRVIGANVAEGTRFESIAAMAMLPDQLYVVDRLARRVFALGGDGNFRYTFGEEELKMPGAITADSHNRIYIADSGDSTIRVFRGGQLEAVVGASADPEGLGFREITDLWENDGLLYVADPAGASVDILRIVPPCP